jgi:hypothetical protein
MITVKNNAPTHTVTPAERSFCIKALENKQDQLQTTAIYVGAFAPCLSTNVSTRLLDLDPMLQRCITLSWEDILASNTAQLSLHDVFSFLLLTACVEAQMGMGRRL